MTDHPITRFFSGLLRGRRIALLRPGWRLLLFAFHFLWRRKNGVQRVAFHSGTELYDRPVSHFFEQPLQHLASQIGMRHFTAAEEDSGLYFVTLFEKAQHVVLLELVVVLVDIDAELHFLDGDDLLVLLRRALLLLLFIQELAVILNTADRRICRSRDLHQIKPTLAGNFEGFKGLHHTKLSTVFVYHTDFAGANTLIGANSTAAKTFVDTFLREIAQLGSAQLCRSIAREIYGIGVREESGDRAQKDRVIGSSGEVKA